MVHSTWGDWFVRDEIEASDPDTPSIWYLGCNGFVVKSRETTIYVDPYFGDGDPPTIVRMIPVPVDPNAVTACNAVLVTHEHIDHIHPPSFEPMVERTSATVYAPSASFERPDYDGDLGISNDRRTVVESGDTFEVGDFRIHVRGAHDPDAIEPVSYVFEHDDGTFFHPGDSKPGAAFERIGAEFDIDVGVLALGSVGRIFDPEEGAGRRTRWYMDETEVVEAANQLELDRLVPSHWDMWRGLTADPAGLVEHSRSFPYPRIVEPVRIGDRVSLNEPGIIAARSLRSDE